MQANQLAISRIFERSRLQCRQYLWRAIGNRDGMLKLRRAFAVSRTHCPAIRPHARFWSASINHRLNRKHHPWTQLECRAFLREMEHIGLLVERTPNAMPCILSHRGKALFLTIFLNDSPNITEGLSRLRLLDTKFRAALCHIHQALRLAIDRADGKGHAGIPYPTVVVHAAIDPNDIAVT